MAETDVRARADERFEAALKAAGARDPRDFYREQMRTLKADDPAAYRRAIGYFNETLIPSVARDDSDPMAEWLEYGRLLATLSAPGRTVQIDVTGKARDYSPPVPPDALVLHLPDAPTRPALVVGIPARLSPAQRAAHDLLARQSQGA
jgi:hypothetical protein